MELPRLSNATLLLIGLNVAVWLLQLANGVPPLHPPPSTLIAWGGNLPLYSLTGDTWRLLTAMFLHGGALHLGLNMLALAFTADRTEDEFGTVRMLVIYVAGGVLASVASVAWSEWQATPGDPCVPAARERRRVRRGDGAVRRAAGRAGGDAAALRAAATREAAGRRRRVGGGGGGQRRASAS